MAKLPLTDTELADLEAFIREMGDDAWLDAIDELRAWRRRAVGRAPVRAQLAAYAHDAWAGWMKYMWSKSTKAPDGSLTIPAASVERWERQMQTPYAALPESEQASDLAEADRMLAILAEAP